MNTKGPDNVLGQLRKLIGPPGAQAVSDGELLRRFAEAGDEAALELLVRRYAPLVWGVCLRLLGNLHDAEDAFQAAFLVLVRRARALDRRGSLAGWLHGVTYRVAVRARASAACRREHEHKAGALAAPWVETAPEARELRQVLDEELNRLPGKYRLPLVLCYLEELTQEQTAQRLGWPLGTVKCRVLRGREQLRRRLARRGLSLPGALLGTALVEGTVTATPAAVLETTITSALQFAARTTTSPSSVGAVALAEGVLKSMRGTRLKMIAAVLIGLVALSSGAGVLAINARNDHPAASQAKPAQEPKPEAARPGDKQTPPPRPELENKDVLEAAWADLGDSDETRALRAALVLATRKDTLPFLKERLKPVLVDPIQVARLIADLEHRTFATRQKATDDLAYMGEHAVPYLRRALEGKPSLEARRRMEQLLDRGRSGPPADWVRAGRAMAVLEHIGAADARAVLQAMARGTARARPTQVADSALGRLARRPVITADARWDDLTGKDENATTRAILALAADPKRAVAFIKEQERKRGPLFAPVEDPRIALLIANLGNEQYAVREKAFTKLVEMGNTAVPALRRALVGNPDVEVSRRVEVALQKIETSLPAKPRDTGPLSRLTVLLEHLGTPEARELLESLRKDKVGVARQAQPVVSPDGRTRLAADKDGGIVLWEAAGARVRWRFQPRRGVVYAALAFSPDSKWVAVGDSEGTVFVLDPTTGKVLHNFTSHTRGIAAVRFSPDSKTLISEDSGKTRLRWDVATGRLLK